ncbi:ricin B lectin domain-containing protein [Trichophaea hybrida]|nr:ricin B lectin domain-containing protein [Trichophaea hybrida]
MSANLCSGVYFIRSAASGTVVHVTGGNDSKLTCSALDYDQAGAQLFEFKLWNDCFIITNVGTKLVMDMSGDLFGSPVVAHRYHGCANQQWHIRRHGDEKSPYHTLTNAHTGTVMDLDGNAFIIVHGWEALGGRNQQWEFVGVTENMLGRQIQVPGPERVVEKFVPGPERIVERIIPGPERVIERVIQGPERVVEKLVVNFTDNPDTLRELRELRAQLSRVIEGLGQTLPRGSGFDTASRRQSGDA